MILSDLEYSLKKIDYYRDRLLFLFIKPYWPRKILPNHLTYLRVAIGLSLFVLLFFFGIENKLLIISLFCVGAITDLFDGSVARGLKKETDFGMMLDPTADKILIIPIAVYSLYQSQKWLLLLLILAEVISGLVFIFQKSRGADTRPNIFGKTKMVLLCIVFAFILIAWPNFPSVFFIDILWASLIFSVLNVFSKVLELKNKGHVKVKNL